MSRTLTNVNISESVDSLREYYQLNKINKTTMIQNTLSLEEFLLKYQKHFGEDYEYSLTMYKRFGLHHARLEIKGAAFDSTDIEEAEEDSYEKTLFASIGSSFRYSYTKGVNVIDFVTERHQMSSLLKLAISIGLAVVLGMIFRYLVPGNISGLISKEVIQPLADTFVGLLSAIVGPVVFFSIVVSTVGVGDVTSLKKIGIRVLRRIFIISPVVFLSAIIIPVCIAGITSGTDTYSPFYIIRDTILGIIPDNIITPFSENSILQLLFWGILIGVGFLSVENQAPGFTRGMTLFNDIFGKIMTILAGLLPIYIFASLFTTIVEGSAERLSGGAIVLYHVIGMSIGAVVLIFLVWIFAKVSPRAFLKNVFSTMVAAGAACSSIIVLNKEIEDLTGNKDYGIDRKKVCFLLPVGQALFKPFNSISDFMIILGVLDISGTRITLSLLLTLFILCFILGIATPSCACSGMAILAILFDTLNIDPVYLATAIALYILLDYFTTALNVMGNYAFVLLNRNVMKKS